MNALYRHPGVAGYSNADGLLDVARVFLNAAPQDRSGEDRTLVVVQVSAENLPATLWIANAAAARGPGPRLERRAASLARMRTGPSMTCASVSRSGGLSGYSGKNKSELVSMLRNR